MTLISSWTNRPGNVGPALDWMLANGAAVPAEAFQRIGLIYAHSDPSAAAAYIDRVPSGARAAWISAVAQGYATTDPQSAAGFLDRFRGDPAYDPAALAVVQPLAESDPAAAARLLASVGTRGTSGVGPEFAIARYWAQRDPAAAASWALDLPLLTRNVALSMVTGAWALQDPDAVREWALRMPPGEKKDAALTAAMRSRGGVPPDAALLGAFSDDRARQGALMNTILATAQTDPAAARRLLDAHITDPRMRASAEQMIDGFASGAVPLPTGGFGVPTGTINGPPPFGVTGVAPGVVYWPAGQPVTVIGPNGQPITLRSPVPGLVPMPGDGFFRRHKCRWRRRRRRRPRASRANGERWSSRAESTRRGRRQQSALVRFEQRAHARRLAAREILEVARREAHGRPAEAGPHVRAALHDLDRLAGDGRRNGRASRARRAAQGP